MAGTSDLEPETVESVQIDRKPMDTIRMRPSNCVSHIGVKDEKKPARCPYCRMYHLRPGFCAYLERGYPHFSEALLRKAWESGHLLPSTVEREKDVLMAEAVTDNPAVTDKPVTDSRSVTDSPATGTAKCNTCGKQFPAKRADAKYCSGACRVKASRRKPR